MDNRHLCRAYIKPLEKIKPVTLIDFLTEEIEVVILDSEKKMKAVRYSFDEVDLMHCTGPHAAKSYRGDSEDDRLVFEGDVLKTITDDEEPEFYRVAFEGFRWKMINSNYMDQDLTDFVNDYTTIEIVGTIHDKEGKEKNV